MARKPRFFAPDIPYHVMNRASARAQIFLKPHDYAAFETVLELAVQRFNLRLLAYILMPNHFHLVLWPRPSQTKTISRFMQWLQQTHTQRWHAHYKNAGEGRLYQGRFKAFPIQAAWNEFHYLRKVCRYVERNALRANLVTQADQWPYSSLHRRLHGSPESQKCLAPWPEGAYPGHAKWLANLHQPLTAAEEKALAQSLARQAPFGSPAWQTTAAARLNLQHTLRPTGRPKKNPSKKAGKNSSKKP
jgi:putative transposase